MGGNGPRYLVGLADEGRKVRRIVGFQEYIDRDPVLADVASRIMRDRDVAHLAPRRHDQPTPGGCPEMIQRRPSRREVVFCLLEAAEPFRRYACCLSGLLLRRRPVFINFSAFSGGLRDRRGDGVGDGRLGMSPSSASVFPLARPRAILL